MTETITQKYIRRYPNSKRTKSWAGKMVHIRTENGIWRTGGHGYTQIGRPDAWVLPFEEAQSMVAHCGPEKQAAFVAAADIARSPVGDLRYTDFQATGMLGEEISCGPNLGRSGFVFEIKDGDKFYMFVVANQDAIRLSDAIKPMKITPELFGAAKAAVLKASEAGEMFEGEPYNIVKAVMKVFGLELEPPAREVKPC